METITGTKEELERQATDLVSKRLRTIEKEKILLGIPGGRSVQGIFSRLKDADIDWSKVHLFWVDERCVPLDSGESNHKLAQETFLQPLIEAGKLPKENIHPYRHNNENPHRSLENYNNGFSSIGDSFDIVILGAGEDGHTASLFPDHPSIQDNSQGFIPVTDSPKPPKDRISASKELLARSDTAFILFLGEGKKDALKRFLDPGLTVNQCPAKVAQLAKHCFLLTDQE